MKKLLKILLALVLVLVLVVGGYVGYIAIQYSRIPDYTPLAVQESAGEEAPPTVQAGQQYTAVTFNIGFGAYDHDFSFFMDSGTMADGTTVKGESSRAYSEALVQTNMAGILGAIQEQNADFVLLQEVDEKADRSFDVDQTALLREALGGYNSIYASNFHTAYLFYPPTKPIGRIEGGVMTFSRYAVGDAVRRSFPVDDSFPTRFFDLDRCFTVQWIPVEGGSGDLVLINVHMSAYDEGGTIRQQQMEMLFGMMQSEYAKGNYVVVGGDFNHSLGESVNSFATGQQVPDWVVALEDSEIPEGFYQVRAENNAEVATCRSSDMSYLPGVNYTTVLDGFIVSANVSATALNIDKGFDCSDHNPVRLTFSLNVPAEGEGEQAPEDVPADEGEG